MAKLDLSRQHKHLYSPERVPALVDVPDLRFISVDGAGAPEDETFQSAIAALYSLSYTLLFSLKKQDPELAWKVMPLEGLWWTDGPECFMQSAKSDWRWTLQIAQPDFVEASHLSAVCSDLQRKGKLSEATSVARLETVPAHTAATVLHIGPYAEEGPTIELLHEFIRASGMSAEGKHREIYLGDPRRAAPEKLRTVLRQPVRAQTA